MPHAAEAWKYAGEPAKALPGPARQEVACGPRLGWNYHFGLPLKDMTRR